MLYEKRRVERILITHTGADGFAEAVSSFCADGIHSFKVWLQVEDRENPRGHNEFFAGTLQFLSDGRVIFASWDENENNPLKPA